MYRDRISNPGNLRIIPLGRITSPDGQIFPDFYEYVRESVIRYAPVKASLISTYLSRAMFPEYYRQYNSDGLVYNVLKSMQDVAITPDGTVCIDTPSKRQQAYKVVYDVSKRKQSSEGKYIQSGMSDYAYIRRGDIWKYATEDERRFLNDIFTLEDGLDDTDIYIEGYGEYIKSNTG